MKQEDFCELINNWNHIQSFQKKLHNIGVVVIDEKYFDSIDYFISYIIKQEYGEIGLDWFEWWYCELPDLKHKNPEKQSFAMDVDGTPIILDTVEQLYNFFEKNKIEWRELK